MLSYIVRFMSGHLHVTGMADPIPDIPLPDFPDFGVGDDIVGKLTDAIGDAFSQMLDAIVQTINDKYLWLLESTLKLMGTMGVPPVELFEDGPLALLLGGVYGLAMNILRLVVVVTALIMIITAARSRQSELGVRTASSILWIMIFTVMFYPIYGLIDSLVRESAMAIIDMIEAARSENGGGEIQDLIVPDDPFGAFITAGIGSIIMLCVLLEVASMWIGTIIVAVWYPMCIAMRPLGKFGIVQLRLATAVLVTTTVSIIPMSFMLALGVLVVGIAGESTAISGISGMSTFISVIFTIVGGIGALLIPYFVFAAAYTKATEMFGSVETSLQHGIDVMSMPPVSVKQEHANQLRNRAAMLASFGAGVATSAVRSEKPTGEVKDQLLARATMAAKTAPDPRVRAAAWAVDFGKMYMQRRKSDQGGDGT